MRLQSREQVEDFMHDVISLALPRIAKSNIRPTSQKTLKNNPAGKNSISQNGLSDGLEGFTNQDNFVYFKVLDNNNNSNFSEVEDDDFTTFVKSIDLIVYIYGQNAAEHAVLLAALMRTNRLQEYLNLNGYYQIEEQNINPLSEIINGQWWDRVDVTFHFGCRVDIPVAPEDRIEYAESYNDGESARFIIDGEQKNAV